MPATQTPEEARTIVEGWGRTVYRAPVRNYWIIRHVPTGGVIPRARGWNGRGGSHVEPVKPLDLTQDPKLFRTLGAAKGWLTVWLRGKQVQWMDSDGESQVDMVAVPSRKREEMEIQLVELRFMK